MLRYYTIFLLGKKQFFAAVKQSTTSKSKVLNALWLLEPVCRAGWLVLWPMYCTPWFCYPTSTPWGRGHLASQSSWSEALYSQMLVLSHKLLTYLKKVYSKLYHHNNILLSRSLSFSLSNFTIFFRSQLQHPCHHLSLTRTKDSLRDLWIVRILGFLKGFEVTLLDRWTNQRTFQIFFSSMRQPSLKNKIKSS